jgi:hypothetical protein
MAHNPKPVRCTRCGCEFLPRRGELDFCTPCLELEANEADAMIDRLELEQLERARLNPGS